MTYFDCIKAAMTRLGQDKRVVVVGYNTRYGGAGGGSFLGIPDEQRIEMPLAEGVMTSAAIGMSLDGLLPIIWYERADFLTNGFDAIVNHLNWIPTLSEGIHRPACIIRVCIGNKVAPLFTGPTHCQNFFEPVKLMCPNILVSFIPDTRSIAGIYAHAYERLLQGKSSIIFEEKDRYREEV